MAVYDWGQDPDGDVPFLVLEYLAGGSLRAMLDRGDTLTPSQALLVGLEATRALEYAHRRGFVHRDIKPANLLFGEEGRLRIADFGLARALAEAAWTEPQGAVLGTARYASPEQAQGKALTGKADVYSLALVLVEAVTGQVPFTADTTIGTLMARVDRDLEVRRRARPAALGADPGRPVRSRGAPRRPRPGRRARWRRPPTCPGPRAAAARRRGRGRRAGRRPRPDDAGGAVRDRRPPLEPTAVGRAGARPERLGGRRPRTGPNRPSSEPRRDEAVDDDLEVWPFLNVDRGDAGDGRARRRRTST